MCAHTYFAVQKDRCANILISREHLTEIHFPTDNNNTHLCIQISTSILTIYLNLMCMSMQLSLHQHNTPIQFEYTYTNSMSVTTGYCHGLELEKKPLGLFFS